MLDTEVKTVIHLLTPTDPDDLYDQAANAVFQYDNVNWTDVHKVNVPVHEQPGVKMLVPIGAVTKMMVCYRPDGKPLSDEGDFLLRQAACTNPDCKPSQHFPAHHMILGFSNAVGYQANGLQNCGEVHAALIYRIGGWLDDNNVKWSWASALSDDTYTGYDNLNKMSEWFADYQRRIAVQEAMAALGPAVPLNSLPGLMIFAEKVAASKADDDDEDDDWEDPYADYVDDDE